MAVGIIKKIIPKVIKKAPKKKAPKKKVKVPLEVKKGPRADKKDMFGNPLSEKGSPYQTVDELAAPLHRRQRYYPVGTEWKKLKESGERVSKWFRKKDGKGLTTDYTQPKLPGLKEGGLIKGFPKIAKKGWK